MLKEKSKQIRFLYWKIALVPVFIFVLIHLLKDITQDLLGIESVFDLLGNVNEDLSGFHPYALWLYHWFMVNTIILELYLLVAIPKTWFRKTFSKIDIISISSIFYLIIAFSIAYLLDSGI